jgi:hypothetical protein
MFEGKPAPPYTLSKLLLSLGFGLFALKGLVGDSGDSGGPLGDSRGGLTDIIAIITLLLDL